MSPAGCPRGDELDAALDGRLAADAVREVLAHAARCLDCDARRAARAQRADDLAAMPDGAPDELRARRLRADLVSAALRRGGACPSPRWPLALGLASTAAAAALAAFAVSRRPAPAGDEALGPGEHRFGHAAVVRPLEGARWSMHEEGGDARVTLHDGAVSLRVRKRAAGERFRVMLRDAEVEVRGTRFEVQARDGLLRGVRVDEGLVAVRRRGEAELLLAAGSRYVAPEAPLAVSVTVPTVARPVAPPAPPVTPPAPPPRRASTPAPDVGRDFREGTLAHARGDHAVAATALGRFLAASAAGDARREDARWVRTLSLRAAGRGLEAEAEAWRYVREFPSGLRRAEAAAWLARSLASRGACDEAARALEAMPSDAAAGLREGASARVATCRGASP